MQILQIPTRVSKGFTELLLGPQLKMILMEVLLEARAGAERKVYFRWTILFTLMTSDINSLLKEHHNVHIFCIIVMKHVIIKVLLCLVILYFTHQSISEISVVSQRKGIKTNGILTIKAVFLSIYMTCSFIF